MTTTRLARAVAATGIVAGLFVLAFTLLWAFDPIETHAPLDGEYGDNAILALEFARSPGEVARVIGPAPRTADRQASVDRIDALNRHDFVYMAAYGALLLAGFFLLGETRSRALAMLGAGLVLIGVVFDALENAALFEITSAEGEIAGSIDALVVFTHAKWSALALATSLYAGLSFWDGGSGLRLASLLGLSATPLAAATVFAPERYAVLLTLSFVPVWVTVFVRCVRRFVRGMVQR